MKNYLTTAKPNNRPTSMLMQLLQWLNKLKLSGSPGGELDIGILMPVPVIDNSLKREKEMINQDTKGYKMKSKYQILKGFALLLLMVASTIGAMGQVGALDKTGTQTVCVDTNESYGVVDTPGSTYSWTITPSGGGIITGNTNVIDVSWTTPGSYEVKVVETNGNGCEGLPTTVTVTVTPLNTIALSSATGTDGQTVCIDSPVTNITYATTGATDAIVSGLPTGVTGSWAGDLVTILGTPSVSGTFTYTVTTIGGCGIATATGTITVISLPTPTALANAPCVTQTLILTGGPAGMSTYSWTGPNGFTSNEQSPSIPNVTPAAAGQYILTVTNANGCSDSVSITVIVNPLPTTSPIWHN